MLECLLQMGFLRVTNIQFNNGNLAKEKRNCLNIVVKVIQPTAEAQFSERLQLNLVFTQRHLELLDPEINNKIINFLDSYAVSWV